MVSSNTSAEAGRGNVRRLRAESSLAGGRRLAGGYTGYLFIAPALIFLVLVIAIPVLATVRSSFLEVDFRNRTAEFVGFTHYARLLADGLFWSSFRNTVLFATGSTIGHIALGTLFALLLCGDWARERTKNFVRGLLILPWLLSLAAASLIWGLLYNTSGPLNYLLLSGGLIDEPMDILGSREWALWFLVLVNIWKAYPFYMVMILGGLHSIPQELNEAAEIDGAGSVRRFWHVTLPMLRPILLTAAAIDMITTFVMFDLVKIMTNGGPQRSTETLSLYIWQVGFRDVDVGYGAAMSVAMLVLLGTATFMYIQLLVRGNRANDSANKL